MSAASTAAAAAASTIVATADAAAVNATAAAAHNPTRHHHPSPPTLPTAIVASGDAPVEAAETTSKRDAVSSVISSTAKISLRAYFKGANWPLNKALPRGAEFSCGPLGGYREGVLSRKIAGSMSATKLQEGEIHEYAGLNPS